MVERRRIWLWALLAGPFAGIVILALNSLLDTIWPGLFKVYGSAPWLLILAVPLLFGAILAVLLRMKGGIGWIRAAVMVVCLALANGSALGSVYWLAPVKSEFIAAAVWSLVFVSIAGGGLAALFQSCRRIDLLALSVVACAVAVLSYTPLCELESFIKISKGVFQPSPVAYPLALGLIHGVFAAVMGWGLFPKEEAKEVGVTGAGANQ